MGKYCLTPEIKAGDNIITSSGIFGKVASVGGDCFLVEFGTNKSVIIPIRKLDVVGIRSPKLSIIQEEVENNQKSQIKKEENLRWERRIPFGGNIIQKNLDEV